MAIGTPDHDKTTANQRRDIRLVLTVVGIGIDRKLVTDCCASCIVTLTEDTGATAILRISAINNHETAIGKAGYRRIKLVAAFKTGAGIDLELGTDLGAAAIKALGVDIVVVAILVEGIPGGDKAATGQRSDINRALIVGTAGVDQ